MKKNYVINYAIKLDRLSTIQNTSLITRLVDAVGKEILVNLMLNKDLLFSYLAFNAQRVEHSIHHSLHLHIFCLNPIVTLK